MEVHVVGAGVSGLTTGVALAEAGFSVVLHGYALPSCSRAAGAIWYPVRLHPTVATRSWARETFHTFSILARDPESGVRLASGIKRFHRPLGLPWWSQFVSVERELVDGAVGQFRATLPVVDPEVYLPYLAHRLEKRGGRLMPGTLDHLPAHHPTVLCAGIDSAQLANDSALVPKAGAALLQSEPLSRFFLSEDAPSGPSTQIPRSQGSYRGTLRCGEAPERLNPTPNDKLLVGVRGKRPCLRVGWEPSAHCLRGYNYGHGGVGFTLSWGIARFLARSLERHARAEICPRAHPCP